MAATVAVRRAAVEAAAERGALAAAAMAGGRGTAKPPALRMKRWLLLPLLALRQGRSMSVLGLRSRAAAAMHQSRRSNFASGGGGMWSWNGIGSDAMLPQDNYTLVWWENSEVKLEVVRMRIRLTDLVKDHVSMKRELVRVSPVNRLLRSFPRTLNSLFRTHLAVEPGVQ
uniref:Uncharacterized protein n=1 Tax=Oryza glumipatula TaxID=40148 RepID=A0A0E0ALZ0_9ORYZ